MIPPLLVTAAIIIHKDQKRILLCRRGREPYKNQWSLIGGAGAFEHMTDPILAVKREVEADIGCEYFPTFFTYSHFDKPKSTVTLYFYGTIEGEIKANPKYCKEWRWFEWEEIPEELGFDHKHILKIFRIENRTYL